MILDLLKENWTMILTFVFTFTVGIGVGAAITDVLNKWEPKPKNRRTEDDKSRQ